MCISAILNPQNYPAHSAAAAFSVVVALHHFIGAGQLFEATAEHAQKNNPLNKRRSYRGRKGCTCNRATKPARPIGTDLMGD